jgi:ornithine cyclodeaminase/alanine dehydrogenase-like protein (mu-crystallin family)
VAGKKRGRKDEAEIIVSMNVGLSIEDIAVGQYIYQRANEQKVGQRLAVS